MLKGNRLPFVAEVEIRVLDEVALREHTSSCTGSLGPARSARWSRSLTPLDSDVQRRHTSSESPYIGPFALPLVK